jgi:hypothetical protein
MAEKRSSKQPPGFFGFKFDNPFIKVKNVVKENLAKKKAEGNQSEPLDAEDFFQGATADDGFADAKAQATVGRRGYDNVLHLFATYNTILTLSGLAEKEMEERTFLTNPVHDIIARTGGIGDANYSYGRYRGSTGDRGGDRIMSEKREKLLNERGKFGYKDSIDVLTKAHDIFFENINIVSTTGPNSERGLANFTKIEFELHEPYGSTLTEKIRAATFINGYEDFQDAPLLLTMEFKGFDEQGQPVSVSHSGLRSAAVTRKFPIVIARVEFEINEGGTRYYCVAVPVGDMAHDDRFKFPRASLNVSVNNIDEWTKEVSKQLDQHQRKEINDGVRELKDKFEFVVDDEVRTAGQYAKTISTNLAETNASAFVKIINEYFAGERSQIDVQPKLKLAAGTVDDNTSLVKYFEDAVRVGEGYQALTDAFWLTYAFILTGREDFKPTRVGTFGDNLKSVYAGLRDYYRSDQFVEDAKKAQFIDWFEIKAHMETRWEEFDSIRKVHPKRIIYKAIRKKVHVLKFIRPGISLGNIDWGQYVVKKYDYLYSGTNVDVQNLKIFYKAAYFLRNINPREKDNKEQGFVSELEKNITAVFGKNNYPEPNAPIRQEVSNIKGRSSMDPLRPKSQQFYDYITNPETDMVKLEMQILGDPIYICQDQFIPIDENRDHYKDDATVSPVFGSFNSEYAQPLIQVNFRVPDDINENTGLMFEKKSTYSERLWFSGIYQVTKVESRINNGEFTQTLYGARLNNQSGDNKGVSTFRINSDGKRLVDGAEKGDVDEVTKKTGPGSSNPRRAGGG